MKPGPFARRIPGELIALAPGVLLWRSIVNSTVLIGSNAVLVVDSQVNHAAARRLLTAIRSRTALPIRYVVNTHYHWDHTNGNALFAAQGAQIIQGRRTITASATRQERQKTFLRSRGFSLDADPQGHDLVAEDLGSVNLGGLTATFISGLSAETDDATLVWVPEAQVLISGDTVMTGSFPILGQPNQREGFESPAWFQALDQVRSFQSTRVAPGHGPAADAAALDQFQSILTWLWQATQSRHQAGDDLLTAIRRIEQDMPPAFRAMAQVWGTPRYGILRVWAGLENLGEPGYMHVKPHAIPSALGQVPSDGTLSELTALAAQAQEGGDPGLAWACAEAIRASAVGATPQGLTAAAEIRLALARIPASVLEKGDCLAPALAELAEALGADPHYSPARLARARCQIIPALRTGDDIAAAEEDLRGIHDDPTLTRRQRAEISWLVGLARRVAGDETEAARHFRKGLSLDPTFMPLHLSLT